MATFKALVKGFSNQEWTVEGGGTAAEAIGKATEEPTAPSLTKFLKAEAIGKDFRISEWTGLPPATARITALTIHIYAKGSKAEKLAGIYLENAAKTKLLEYKPTLATTAAWYKESLTKAAAEALTKADIEKLALEVNVEVARKVEVFEVYITGEYVEPKGTPNVTGGGKVTASGSKFEPPHGTPNITGGGNVTAHGRGPLPVGTLTPYSTATVTLATTFARGIVITPDGKHVYVGYFGEGANHISCLERQAGGELKTLVPEQVEAGGAVRSLAVSPDGKHVYALCYKSAGELWAYSRNETTGVLTKVQALTSIGSSYPEAGGPGIVVSPDGKHVYTVNHAGSILGFERNASTGALTKLSGEPAVTAPLGIGISPDGKHVYVGDEGEQLWEFSRNETTGELTNLGSVATPAKEPWGAVVSPDGATVYVGLHAVNQTAQYQRSLTTGLLTALSPSSVEGHGGPAQVVVSPDGKSVYSGSYTGRTLSAYSRAVGGALTPLSPRDTAEVPIQGYALCISPDGLSVYTTAQEPSRVVQYAREPYVPPPPSGSASVTGGGAVLAKGMGVAVGSAKVSGGGVVVVSTRASRQGKATVTTGGTVSATVRRVARASASITGAGAVGVHGIGAAVGSAKVTGGGAVSTTQRRFAKATALVTSAGAVLASGHKVEEAAAVAGSAAVSGGGAVTASGRRLVKGSAVVSGGGSVTASGLRARQVVATVTGAGAVTASAARTASALAVVTGGGLVTVRGLKPSPGIALVTGGGAVKASGSRIVKGTAAVTGGGAVTVPGGRVRFVSAVVSGGGATVATGRRLVRATAAVTGSGLVIASGSRVAKAAAAVTGGGAISAGGHKVEAGAGFGSALVHGGGAVLTKTFPVHQGTVTVTGAGAIMTRAGRRAQGSASITTGGSPQATGRKAAKVTASVSGAGTITVSAVRLARGTPSVTGGGRASTTGGKADIKQAVALVHGGGRVTAFGSYFHFSIPVEPGGSSTSRATTLSPEPRVIDPSVCWVRHVVRGVAGQPSAQPVARVYFVREDVLTGNDGLNGRAGWQLAQTTAALSNDGSFSIALPNGPGEDGILHRRRFKILTDENYEPGEEWLEFWRDPNDLVFVGTPTDYEKTPSTVTIKGIDLPEVLGGSLSSEVDSWDGHAPIDVMRHYCRLAYLVTGVDLSGVNVTSGASKWSGETSTMYQRTPITGCEPDCWTAEARCRMTSARPTAAGQQYAAMNLWSSAGLICSLRVDLWEGLVYITSHWLEGAIEDQRIGLLMPGEVDFRVVARYDRLFFFIAGELVTEMRRWGIRSEGGPYDAPETLEVTSYNGAVIAVDGVHVESLAPFASRGASVPAVRKLPGLPPPTGLRARYFNAAQWYAASNKIRDIRARLWPLGEEPVADRVEAQLNPGQAGTMPNLPGAVAVRWQGSIYLDLATSDRQIELHLGGSYTRVYVGRTLRHEPYLSNWGEASTQPWFEGEQHGPMLRAWLGTSEAGWYPIVIEQHKAGPGYAIILADRPAEGLYAPVPQSRLSPIGVYADTVRVTPHRKVFGDIATTFGYQWRVEHRSLESGEFPGQVNFAPLLGRQTNVTIDDEAVGTQAQVQGAALDCVDGLMVDAAGLADPKGSGQLSAQTVNYERAVGHMALRQVYESLAEISEEPLVEQRADSLLALRSSPNEQVGVRPSGQRDVVDLLPLTGAKAKLDWQPGDGVVLCLNNLDVRDESPRQLTGVTWNLHPDGTGAPTVTFRQRPRDIRTTLRKLTSAILGPRRTYQGQVSIITGTFGGLNLPENVARAGCVDQYSRLALPVPWEQIIGVWLNVFELSGAGWLLDIAGTTFGTALTTTGRYEVTAQLKPWNPPQNGTYALLLGASTGYYCCQLEARVIL